MALLAGAPALAQGAPEGAGESLLEEIVVTAQRQAESLQDVPIAVSAFSAEQLERQQIENTSDLQLTLPNITFTKTNFTSSNFSIRGIGESVVATSADQGVGIHFNDMPINAPRLFEIEFYDLERIEVLRGPQGTLFGRNATGGVVNVISKRPTDEFEVNAEAEYANYNSVRLTGAVNVPINDWIGARVAGIYVNRDGYTKNIYDDSRIDGRDSYAFRGTLRFEPTDNTTLDLIGSYFKEDSDRSRIQKQLCHRDPTGVLGCAPDRLAAETVNANATLAGTATSAEFLRIAFAPSFIPATTQRLVAAGLSPAAAAAQAQALFAGLPLGSVYGPDAFAGVANPADLRTVRLDYNPTYASDELIAMARLEQKLGDYSLTVTGGYAESSVTSRTDYNLTASNPLNLAGNTLGLVFPASRAALFQGNNICVSDVDRSYVGYVGGKIDRCAANTTEYDQSAIDNKQWSIEAHVDSRYDGPFNFLLGGIYMDAKSGSDYFIGASGLDYASALLGGGVGGLTSPIYNNEVDEYRLKAWAVFGEAYYEFNDELKLTLGARYTTDDKSVRDRQAPLLSGPTVPFGTTSIADRIPYRETSVKFDRLTGRIVLDWKPVTTWSDDTLVYASYSRGYKGGGVNPAFDASQFTAPATFAPETVNAFEIGTKNRFGGGAFQANITAFYYDYKDYQVSRIINRTSFNDNTDATVYGLEGEFLIAPSPSLLFNINASYLKTKIKDLQLVDARDPSAGRDDVVIIKDVTNASNCVVAPNQPGAPRADAFVAAVNSRIGLRAPTAVPGTNTTGAFSVCSALRGALATTGVNPLAPIGAGNPALSTIYGVSDGVPVDLSGNELQNSPNFKVSIGGQHTWDFDNGMSLVARVDYAFTGEYYGRNFNKPIDRIASYDVINAQITLNGAEERWFLRAFVQNLENDDSITGMYVTDPATGLFTNVFTLEPRRYGVAAGVRF